MLRVLCPRIVESTHRIVAQITNGYRWSNWGWLFRGNPFIGVSCKRIHGGCTTDAQRGSVVWLESYIWIMDHGSESLFVIWYAHTYWCLGMYLCVYWVCNSGKQESRFTLGSIVVHMSSRDDIGNDRLSTTYLQMNDQSRIWNLDCQSRYILGVCIYTIPVHTQIGISTSHILHLLY